MVSAIEKLNVKFYLNLIDLDINRHMYLVATILDRIALDCYMRNKFLSCLDCHVLGSIRVPYPKP